MHILLINEAFSYQLSAFKTNSALNGSGSECGCVFSVTCWVRSLTITFFGSRFPAAVDCAAGFHWVGCPGVRVRVFNGLLGSFAGIHFFESSVGGRLGRPGFKCDQAEAPIKGARQALTGLMPIAGLCRVLWVSGSGAGSEWKCCSA